MSDINLFCALLDFVKNSLALRACAFKYNVHSIIIKNLLGEYKSHQINKKRQEKEPLVDTNNQN